MAYIGYEKDRGTLKYRCPARHEGWACPSEAKCNAGQEVRADGADQVRGWTCGGSRRSRGRRKQFERLYKGRTAVERVNARLKIFWGVDDGNVVGARRFHAYVGVVMVVHAAVVAMLLAQAAALGGHAGPDAAGASGPNPGPFGSTRSRGGS